MIVKRVNENEQLAKNKGKFTVLAKRVYLNGIPNFLKGGMLS